VTNDASAEILNLLALNGIRLFGKKNSGRYSKCSRCEGRGGAVILEVDASSATLLDFHRRPVRRAGNGRQGEGSNRTGADGTDLIIPVPNGTEVKTAAGEVLADLIGVGTRFVAAAGGRGGLGNAAALFSVGPLIGIVLIALFAPETRGKSLEELSP